MATPISFNLARKFLVPLLVAILLGSALYFGGQSYHVVGLAAFESMQQVLTYGVGIAEIIVVALLIYRFLRYIVLEGVVAGSLGTPVPRLLIQLSALIVVIAATAAILGIVFKQDLTVLWAASGVLGFVFGMALKDMILDVFTGIALNLDRPIRIGDIVQLHRTGDQVIEGKVLEINWRATRLLDDFGNVVIVPNSRLGGATITNFSMPDLTCWIIVPVTLDAEIPPARATRILEAAAVEGIGPFLSPDGGTPFVGIKALTATGIDYVVCLPVLANKRMGARTAVVQQVWRHLTQAGIRPSAPKLVEIDPVAELALREAPFSRQVALLFGGTALFQDFPAPAREHLARTVLQHTLAPQTVLVQAGEAATAIFLVLEGLVSVEERGGTTLSKGEPPRLWGPGSLLGARATLMAEGYDQTIRCRTTVRVAEISLPILEGLFAAYPGLMRILSRRLAEEITSSPQPAGMTSRLMVSSEDPAADVLATLRRLFPEIDIG
jgi:small-conductance mechanosensitive channel/CRP-like cAMP-binding protein